MPGTHETVLGRVVGPRGPNGNDGRDGKAASIKIGGVTASEPGGAAQVTNSGSETAAVFNFTLPRGIQGTTGAAGKAATVAVDSTVTGAAGTEAKVENVGTTNAAKLKFTVPRGNTGAKGADGAAATIEVGTVTTGAAGTNVSVTNVGTAAKAKFNFTIPRGATGAKGEKGEGGNLFGTTMANAKAMVLWLKDLASGKVQMVHENGTELYPVTKAAHVTASDGKTVQEHITSSAAAADLKAHKDANNPHGITNAKLGAMPASNWNWSGQSGQPAWLWGGNENNKYYVWNPSNFNVKYATSAGSATDQTARNTANAAMPKTGGTFTGNVVAYGSSRGNSIRNINVQNSSASNQNTVYILMRRRG